MSAAFSDEIRLAVLIYIEENRKTTWIVIKLNVSKRQVRRMKSHFYLYASMISSIKRNDSFKIIDEIMKETFLDWINHRFTVYLNEMCLFLYDEFDIVVIIWIIKKLFKRVDWTHKKIDIIFF